MPHTEAPRPSAAQLPVYVNLDSSVANRGANSNSADILLAQFLLRAINLRLTTAEGTRAAPILSQTPLTGVVDRQTVGLIRGSLKPKIEHTIRSFSKEAL